MSGDYCDLVAPEKTAGASTSSSGTSAAKAWPRRSIELVNAGHCPSLVVRGGELSVLMAIRRLRPAVGEA